MPPSTLQADLLDALRSGGPVTRFQIIEPAALPEPYRTLLDHDRDMTSTLEAHHQDVLRLRVLRKHLEDGALTREVVLETGAGTAVEYGAIRINIDAFDPAPRNAVEACTLPLGAILEQFGVPYTCRPSAFFRTACADLARAAFALDFSGHLYGRRNTILSTGAPLAEVIEILAPADPTGEGAHARNNGRA